METTGAVASVYAGRFVQTNPWNSYGLSVTTQTANSYDVAFSLSSNAGAKPLMIVQNDGKVGMGTLSPKAGLDVRATDVYISPSDQTTGSETRLYLTPLAGSQSKVALVTEANSGWGRGKFHIAINTAADTTNATKSDARLTVDSTGNVGIGTTSPAAKLDVFGGSKSSRHNFALSDGGFGSGNSIVGLHVGA